MKAERTFAAVLLAAAVAAPQAALASSISALPAMEEATGPSIVVLATLTPALEETLAAEEGRDGHSDPIPMTLRGGISGPPARRAHSAPKRLAPSTPFVSSASASPAPPSEPVRRPE